MAYLTKSRFKLGLECPTKLYYDSFRTKYNNQKQDDPFMEALAKGGFQVGELSKLHYPNGIDIVTLNPEDAVKQTEEALLQDEVVIFEAAFLVGHRFIRVDILHKTKNQYRIIEVKSKSCDTDNPEQFYGKTGGVISEWRPYLEDISFQYLVVKEYFSDKDPDRMIQPYLMMPDKSKSASVDGIHQKFVLLKDANGRNYCKPASGVTLQDLGAPLLTEVNVADVVGVILNDSHYESNTGWGASGFENVAKWFEELLLNYESDSPKPFFDMPGVKCKKCQFKTKNNEAEKGKVSGYRECFETRNVCTPEDINAPKVWDVWNYTSAKNRVEEGRWLMSELTEEDIATTDTEYTEPVSGEGINSVQRRWIQVDGTNSNSVEAWVDIVGLRQFMGECNPPYHFIDFETLAPAIPFYKGYSPYQGLCFQFSHHIIHEDGSVEHKAEYLGEGQGVNPSFEFIDRLCQELSQDEGSVFMYHVHENTYLNYMIRLLLEDSPFDSTHTEKLIEFLKSISKPVRGSAISWSEGPRMMKDMRQMVLRYFWHPVMGGSNSIKQVLPAVLNSSSFLQAKYKEPVYGAEGGIPSLNFKNGHRWLQRNNAGEIFDPYKLLPDMKELLPMGLDEMELLYSDEKVGNGGAAMTAWAYMQYADMNPGERDAIAEALKCYCELDTMAMVMIWEYFYDVVHNK